MMNNSVYRVWLVRVGLMIMDAICWLLATINFVWALYGMRLSFDSSKNLTANDYNFLVMYVLSAIGLQLVVGIITKLYRGRHSIGSFEDALLLAIIVMAVGAVLAVIFVFFGYEGYPRGITLTTPFGALVLMGAGRFVVRALTTKASSASDSAESVLIYGAGNAGQQLGRLLTYDPDAPFQIMGYIDDDPAKKNLHLAGTKVLGGRESLVEQAEKLNVKKIIIAIPTADRKFMNDVSKIISRAGIKTLVMPSTKDIVGGKVQIDQLHELSIDDILGRSQIETSLSEIARYLSDKVVLITGAGGTIGSEIARQVHKFGPKELVLLDRDESGLHGTQLSIYHQALLDTPDIVLCDIRDFEALDKIFADHKPDVVFHTAALKHLPLLEQYPLEGWKTNVLGSLNVLRAAEKHGVEHYVNISTDKAADATTTLGKTKRLAEELTSYFAKKTGKTFLSVRFGNVLGSSGSMFRTFMGQIKAGGPVTVTHPDITRFFMTIPEACELTIQAGAIGKPGDVLVLDMGEPVRILDVAKMMIEWSGHPIEIVFTGLRPNEKLDEVLFSKAEDSEPTSHKMISQVNVPPLDPKILSEIDGSNPKSLDAWLRQKDVASAQDDS